MPRPTAASPYWTELLARTRTYKERVGGLECLTAVWSGCGRWPVLRFGRVGTVDDLKALPPDVPAVEIYDDMEKLWPAESLARRMAIFG
jgi:hypothetical protein